MSKVIFVTGAGRGLGTDIARQALAMRPPGRRHRPPPRKGARRARRRAGQPAGHRTGHHQHHRRPSGRRCCRGPLRPHRRADQQRRNLPGRLLRGDLRGADAGADRDEPVRPDERNPRRPARHAQAACRSRRHDLLAGKRDRPGVLRRLRRIQVRHRGLDGIPALRPGALRHQDHDRRARFLPHRTPRGRLHQLGGGLDRGLRRTHRRDQEDVAVDER